MADLWTWLVGVVGPLVKRGLAALGIGWVTSEGWGALAGSLRDQVISAWGAVGGSVVQVLELAGMQVAIGIMLGAIIARAALAAFSMLGKVL